MLTLKKEAQRKGLDVSGKSKSEIQVLLKRYEYKDFLNEEKVKNVSHFYPYFLDFGEYIESVIEKDDQFLKSMNLTHDQIANTLDYIISTATLNATKKRNDGFIEVQLYNISVQVSFIQTLGHENCPFGCSYEHVCGGSMDITLKHNNKMLFTGDLLVHLIKEHHFFEGNVKYRLDPKKFIELIGIDNVHAY